MGSQLYWFVLKGRSSLCGLSTAWNGAAPGFETRPVLLAVGLEIGHNRSWNDFRSKKENPWNEEASKFGQSLSCDALKW